MCRLLGIVAASPYEFGHVLHSAPRSMAMLSREHRDGWGLASHTGSGLDGWNVQRSTLTADDDPEFVAWAHRARGRVLLAHVRQKTVGPLAIENTHPFHHGEWVFAHNGTVKDVAFLDAHTSRARRAECEGTTDSERLFAYFLTALDEAGPTDTTVARAARTAVARPDFGTLNFLLSDGHVLYVGRFGRPLHMLERVPVTVDEEYPLSHRSCVVVASEPLTDERWTEIEQGTMLRLDVAPAPRVRTLTA